MFKTLLFLLAFVAISLARKSYSGYQVIKTEKMHSGTDIVELMQWVSQQEVNAFDFWIEPRTVGHSASIMVKPGHMDDLTKYLNLKKIAFEIQIDDVEVMNRFSEMHTAGISPNAKLDWKNYYGTKEMNAYMEELAKTQDYISVVSIGKSYEDRDMKVIKIEKAGKNAPNIWIEAGIHAREWISPAMSTFFMHELVEKNSDLLDKLNFYILPSANPDGYEFSRSDDRLWRKTRSDTGSVRKCKGVDANRNWDFHFGESGVSSDKCSQVYPGKGPFSEIEMQNVRDFVKTLSPVPVLSLCLHSAAELWLYPYGYAYNQYPDNVAEIRTLATEAVNALNAVHGEHFEVINSAELYPAAGASDDWYQGVLGSRFTYTVELRKGGSAGFDLPPEQIIPSGEELWAAMQIILAKMINPDS